MKPIILHEQANKGRTIIEKFEKDAREATFAIVLLTPDDIGYPKGYENKLSPRARQNVIFELGFFIGILGRENVAVLYKEDVEIPSDYSGVIYIKMELNNSWKYELVKEMKESGLDVTADNVK